MTEQYILEGKIPVKEPDLLKWGKWFEENNEARTVGRDVFRQGKSEITVSTVFLGLDHGWGLYHDPILFETMVFGGQLDQTQERCSTWDEAEVMHKNMCAQVKRSFMKLA